MQPAWRAGVRENPATKKSLEYFSSGASFGKRVLKNGVEDFERGVLLGRVPALTGTWKMRPWIPQKRRPTSGTIETGIKS